MRLLVLTISIAAAAAALGKIVFAIMWRGHYVYCDPIGECLNLASIWRFAPAFAFLFVTYVGLLSVLAFATAAVRRIVRNRLEGKWKSG